MAALVVTVSPANGLGEKKGRIGIFPGGATTTMYPRTRRSGWGTDSQQTRLGEPISRTSPRGSSSTWTAEPVSMLTDVHTDSGLPVRKTNIAEFPDGLPVGWHDFTGRWYDGGRLILSSRAAIQFVER